MKIKTNLSIVKFMNVGDDHPMKIKIECESSGITFLDLDISPINLLNAITGSHGVTCSAKLIGLEHIGKRFETKKFEFKLPKTDKFHDKKLAKKTVSELCPEGYEPNLYFNSQDSFFRKDDEDWARTHIYRYVDIPEEE